MENRRKWLHRSQAKFLFSSNLHKVIPKFYWLYHIFLLKGQPLIKKYIRLDFSTLIVIYTNYCAQIWGCLGATLSNKVQKLQNRAFRIITRESYTTRSIDILSKLNIPNLEQRRSQQHSVLMYKIDKKLVPDYLRNMFTNTRDIHIHNTRQSDVNLVLPKPGTNYMKCSFGYRGAENWNALPNSFKKSESITIFKSLLRRDTR